MKVHVLDFILSLCVPKAWVCVKARSSSYNTMALPVASPENGAPDLILSLTEL